MKKLLFALLIIVNLLFGCTSTAATPSALQPSLSPSVSPTATTQVLSAPTTQAALASTVPLSPSAATASPAVQPERTPDPSSEMLVTGTVTALLENAIEVKADNLQKELVITMLDRAVYAGGVPKKFRVGNYVRIITSNKLATTLPERTAARMVLENGR